jgi:hypothetical protein
VPWHSSRVLLSFTAQMCVPVVTDMCMYVCVCVYTSIYIYIYIYKVTEVVLQDAEIKYHINNSVPTSRLRSKAHAVNAV